MSKIFNVLAGHQSTPPVEGLSITDVVDRIEALNRGLKVFWSQSQGWAPVEAAGLLSKSRLDRQESLSASLRRWVSEPAKSLTDGDLILAWSNLGSLVEGTLKLLLSVYYEQFKTDVVALKKAADPKSPGKAKDPDGLELEPLRQFFKEKQLLGAEADSLIALVQQRRNAIHAFKDRPIGTPAEFEAAVKGYLVMLRRMNGRLPYPDAHYVPQES